MKITPNIRLKNTFVTHYWRATRNVLAINHKVIIDAVENINPERLTNYVDFLLFDNDSLKSMNENILSIWEKVGGRYGYDTEMFIANNKNKKATNRWQSVETWNEPVGYSRWKNWMREYASERSLQKSKAIMTTEQEYINKIITDVVKEANSGDVWLSIADTKKLLKERLAKELVIIEDYQAERIAITEVNGAANRGAFESAKENSEGVMKEWMTTGMPNVRESHLAHESLGPQEMDFEYNTGLKFPGDDECDIPEEVINCHCTYTLDTVQ
jgi:bacterioferritin (cytochrome b1)